MKIVFDMDNTLVDELGQKLRPGIKTLLQSLCDDGHELALWTSSSRTRAELILQDHALTEYFSDYIFREDYDPDNDGKLKDVRTINGDVLIDDDPKQIDSTNEIGKLGILIHCYRGRSLIPLGELDKIRRQINRRSGLFRIFKRLHQRLIRRGGSGIRDAQQ